MFYDLNIPYPVQHSQNLEYAQNELRKSIDTLVKFGYHIVAYNNTNTGKVASKKPNPIQKLDNEKIKQYTRLTILIDDPGQNYGLTSSNSTISSYDLVAVQPTNEKLFQMACGTFDVDIISLEMGSRLPFYFKHTTVGLAIDRGIYFEISYAPAIRDSGSRRQLISNAQNLVRITRGRNIIITSDAQRAMELRGPYDIINLGTIMGLNQAQAKDCISTNCRAVLLHAITRTKTHKSVISYNPVSELEPHELWKAGDSSGKGKKRKQKKRIRSDSDEQEKGEESEGDLEDMEI